MSIRAAAVFFAFFVVALLLMPARYLFLLVGAFMLAAGGYGMGASTAKGLLVIIVGAAFLALGGWVFFRERQAAANEIRETQERARALANRNRR